MAPQSMTNAPLDLDGKVALVTGAAGGIGAGIAEVLGDAGAMVVIADIDEARARQQADVLAQAGAKAEAIGVDLAEGELAARRRAWTAPPVKATGGVLGKYIRLVRPASEGCVTD